MTKRKILIVIGLFSGLANGIEPFALKSAYGQSNEQLLVCETELDTALQSCRAPIRCDQYTGEVERLRTALAKLQSELHSIRKELIREISAPDKHEQIQKMNESVRKVEDLISGQNVRIIKELEPKN